MRTRAPPAPTLKNVLVSHPSSAAQGTVATPDDFLTTAMLAADDNHDLSRRRGVLARVTRKWHNLWHRRSSSSRRRDGGAANNNNNSNNNDGSPAANALSALRLRRPRQMLTAPDPAAAMESTQVAPFHAPSASNNGGLDASSSAGVLVPAPGTTTPGGVPSRSTEMPYADHQSQQQQQFYHNDSDTGNTQPHQVIALPYHPTHATPTTVAAVTTVAIPPGPSASGGGEHLNPSVGYLQHHQTLPTQQSSTSALKTPFDTNLAPATSQVVLSRERRLRAEREEQMALERAADDDLLDELTTSSTMSREPSRRVRQVGARVGDDTLLELPRVDPISLSLTEVGVPGRPIPAIYHHQQLVPMPPGLMAVNVNPNFIPRHSPKVRQLPRVSGLMPTRVVRAPLEGGTRASQDLTSSNNNNGMKRGSSRVGDRATPVSFGGSGRSEDDYDDDDDDYDDDDDNYVDEEDEEEDDDDGEQQRRANEIENRTNSTPNFPTTTSSGHPPRPGPSSSINLDVEDDDDDHFIDDENVDEQIDDDDIDDDDDAGNTVQQGRNANEPGAQQQQRYRIPRAPRMQRMPIARLPTGLSRHDVEREMERAVVEIASDGDDDDNGKESSSSDVEGVTEVVGEAEDGRQIQSQTQGKGRGVASANRGDDDDAALDQQQQQGKQHLRQACHSSADSAKNVSGDMMLQHNEKNNNTSENDSSSDTEEVKNTTTVAQQSSNNSSSRNGGRPSTATRRSQLLATRGKRIGGRSGRKDDEGAAAPAAEPRIITSASSHVDNHDAGQSISRRQSRANNTNARSHSDMQQQQQRTKQNNDVSAFAAETNDRITDRTTTHGQDRQGAPSSAATAAATSTTTTIASSHIRNSDVLSRRVTSASCTQEHTTTTTTRGTNPSTVVVSSAVPYHTQSTPGATTVTPAPAVPNSRQMPNGIINLNLNLGSLSFGLVGFGSNKNRSAHNTQTPYHQQQQQQQQHDSNINNNRYTQMIGAGSTSTAAAYLAGDAGFAPSPPGMGGSRRGGGRFQQQQNDVALFEDDYLSFQGFHSSGDSSSLDSAHNGLGSSGNGSGNGGLRAYYFNSGMSLLRSKRMSSVTDSHSDESVDALQKQALQQQQQQLAMQKQLAMDDSMAHNMSSASACDVVELQVRPRSESLSRRNHRYNVNNNNNANTNSNGLGVLAHKSSKRSLVGGFSGGGGQPVARQRGHGQSGRSGGGNGDGELNRSGRLPMILKLRKWSSLEEQQQSM